MKKYKNILIVIVAFVLCGALAVSGSALLQNFDVEDYKSTKGFTNETISKYLSTTDLFDNKVNVHYVDTVTDHRGLVTNRYVDETGNEYRYNADGTLRSVYVAEEMSDALREKVVVPTFGKTSELNEKQAKELGTELLREFIGEDFKNYKFKYLQNVEDTKSYYVGYAKFYSNDVIGEYCIAGFDYDGTVRILSSHSVGVMQKMDLDILKNVTDQTLDTFIRGELNERKSDDESLLSYMIRDKKIKEKDEKMGISIRVVATYNDAEGGVAESAMTLFYPFPDQAAVKK